MSLQPLSVSQRNLWLQLQPFASHSAEQNARAKPVPAKRRRPVSTVHISCIIPLLPVNILLHPVFSRIILVAAHAPFRTRARAPPAHTTRPRARAAWVACGPVLIYPLRRLTERQFQLLAAFAHGQSLEQRLCLEGRGNLSPFPAASVAYSAARHRSYTAASRQASIVGGRASSGKLLRWE